MTTAPRNWLRALSLWLSLATVLTCAIASFGSPVRASTGSAFNAFTSDVSLGPSRASAPERESREAPAPGGAGEAEAVRAARPLALHPGDGGARPSFAAPLLPASRPSAGAVGARAPPLA